MKNNINKKLKYLQPSLRVEEAPQIKDWGSCHEVTEGADCQKQSITWQFAPFCKGGCHAKHDSGIFILLALITCIIISQPSFAKSKLKTKLSNFFQKIEKKIDTKTDDTASKTTGIRAQVASAPVIIASTTKKLTLEDFGLLPQEQLKIDILHTQKILKKFDTQESSFYCCQGMTIDENYIYIALLSYATKEVDKHTKIIKINKNNLEVVKQVDLGPIGHSNCLTYNSLNKKIYIAPFFKDWETLFELDTDLNNLKKVYLINTDGSIINDKQIRSIAYLPKLNQYIIKFDEYTLAFFDSNFKIMKILKTKQDLHLKKGNGSQALSTDGKNIFSITNTFNINKLFPNYILIYDMNGNYIDKYSFENELGGRVELQQLAFFEENCYALAGFKGNYRLYKINLRKN